MKKSKPDGRPKTAVAYARYSSAGQRDVSIEQQLQDIRAYAQREGYTLVHEYADHARSGYRHTSSRAEFLAMLAAAGKGGFDAVIVWKVDRFGRNREDAAIYKAQLRREGVAVLYAMEPIPAGAAGVLTEGMLESIAEWYSRNLAENVLRGMRDNAAKGLYNGNRFFGYRRGPDGHFQIHEQEAAVIRTIYTRYIEGYSAAAIASELNAQGAKTSCQGAFTSQYILRLITNERFKGVYRWDTVRIPGGIPAIVTEKEWEDAQRMRSKTGRHYEQHQIDFLLTGKAFCGLCGAAMVGDSGTSHTGSNYYYYTCQAKKARKECPKKSIRKETLEDAVLDFVVTQCLAGPQREEIANAIVSAQQANLKNSPIVSLENDLRETEKKIDRVNDAIEAGIWNSSTSVRLKSLEDAADSLRRVIEQQRFMQGQLLEKKRVLFFLDEMAQYDLTIPARRRQLIDTFINAVYVYDGYARIAINCVEGNARIPLPDVEALDLPVPGEGSDNDMASPPSTRLKVEFQAGFCLPLDHWRGIIPLGAISRRRHLPISIIRYRYFIHSQRVLPMRRCQRKPFYPFT